MAAKKVTKRPKTLAEQVSEHAVIGLPEPLLRKVVKRYILEQLNTDELYYIGNHITGHLKGHLETVLKERINSGDFDDMLYATADKLIKKKLRELAED